MSIGVIVGNAQDFLKANNNKPAIWFGKSGPKNWNDIYCHNWN